MSSIRRGLIKETIAITLVLNLLVVSSLGCVKLDSGPATTPIPTLTSTETTTPTIEEDELTLELKNLPELDWALKRIFKPSAFVEDRDYIRMVLDIYKSNPRMSNLSGEPLLYAILWLGIEDGQRSDFAHHVDVEYLESDIIPLAKGITTMSSNDTQAVKAIQEWQKNAIKYAPTQRPTLKNTLENEEGGCVEKSKLIVTLCRSVGIPARLVWSKQINHAWAQAYVEGSWVDVASSGLLDHDEDGFITYSDLRELNLTNMADVFVEPPYYAFEGYGYDRLDLTLGYNRCVIEQMITEAQDTIGSARDLEENVSQAKELLFQWENEKSSVERNRIGRQIMESLLSATMSIEEDVSTQDVLVVFLEDLPRFLVEAPDGELVYTPRQYIEPFEDVPNAIVSWRRLEGSLLNSDPKVLCIFDTVPSENLGKEMYLEQAETPPILDLFAVLSIKQLIEKYDLDVKTNIVIGISNVTEFEVWGRPEIDSLALLFDTYYRDAPALMLEFVQAINRAQNQSEMVEFWLPPTLGENYSYRISAAGPVISENGDFIGYSLMFRVWLSTTIGRLTVDVGSGHLGEYLKYEYTNLVFIDEIGRVYGPEEKDGKYYYKAGPSILFPLRYIDCSNKDDRYYFQTCPSILNLQGGSHLKIQRQDGLILINTKSFS
ncbi:MAG: transglutaminase-like domain-containing protein [Methanocellales archaeon]|nr:transglutaminase-like domain-containing protein [Methanocellales archaeon]MDD3291696.1 transglutaminase-like domain-containing protein [Methanocellales archaeon]MDD5235046.1 transglutaminase-like domain-containing protein [Methanocellales archaeon]MDD5485184.1 transglutaminase-like domain-containing protein [Methanocellales archaeon]